MMDRKNRLTINAAAAAVALALGTSFAQAQQQQPRSVDEQAQPAQQTREAQDRAEDRADDVQDRAEQRAQTAQDRAQDSAEAQQSRAQPAGQQGASSGGDLANLGDEHDDLSTFAKALESAGLIDSLSDGTNYTIFAPTNEAFESMRGDAEELLSAENREELVELLRAHIVADDVDATRAGQLQEARTIDGGTVELKTEDGKLMVGDATVVDADIERGNVRIHTIDEVLARTRTAAADRDEDRELR